MASTDRAYEEPSVRDLARLVQEQSGALGKSIAEVKSSVVGLLRQSARAERESHPGVDLATLLIRGLTCQLIAKLCIGVERREPEDIAREIYGGAVGPNATVKAITDLPAVLRAVVNPAMTGTAGWASELTQTNNYVGPLTALSPASTYARLSARGLRLNFAGAGYIKLPARSSTPLVNGAWVSEGDPIPVRRLGLTSTTLGPPRKLACISTFSAEIAEYSVPSIEALLRDAIAFDTNATLDATLLDNAAATPARPAGLLNGVTPLTASALAGVSALAADLGALAGAIPRATDLVFLMNASERTRAVFWSPILSLDNLVIEAPAMPAKQVVAIDVADFVSGEGDTPAFLISEDAVLNEEDTSPLAIGTPGTPPTVAAPSRSLWQSDAVALRLVARCIWAMRRTGRVAVIQNVTW